MDGNRDHFLSQLEAMKSSSRSGQAADYLRGIFNDAKGSTKANDNQAFDVYAQFQNVIGKEKQMGVNQQRNVAMGNAAGKERMPFLQASNVTAAEDGKTVQEQLAPAKRRASAKWNERGVDVNSSQSGSVETAEESNNVNMTLGCGLTRKELLHRMLRAAALTYFAALRQQLGIEQSRKQFAMLNPNAKIGESIGGRMENGKSMKRTSSKNTSPDIVKQDDANALKPIKDVTKRNAAMKDSVKRNTTAGKPPRSNKKPRASAGNNASQKGAESELSKANLIPPEDEPFADSFEEAFNKLSGPPSQDPSAAFLNLPGGMQQVNGGGFSFDQMNMQWDGQLQK
uniref:Uncharacterized protein n=1 Tax=Rhodosorus marinus TaxID=101924 RepID=A0A7S3E8Q5_9RHOD|mmetsp:Transcript_17455/g.70723  ORF Transcript_17455/g.70723 Transcript_17455/m.70723 type:complete len:341 (+) Transcript_17455:477-1499(+)|eukprot:CAMPEP_0113967574 /NCGR_PEP_ID=MMETSP0011_2-20120614/9017_1 /TAXON_ID=101924 /ORGANISM="Rhodosorus marinus" /LENGTH=340 /DNA_ID=CAMNT_0000980495 /DNA_START=262 /DNA_END=1284 /DNA_ORIENTATION=- /assembly_acc=CAM_ASM_000156